ncbi:MAG: undecaprenyl-phosphate glucose phosphotransferase [Lachnospiraceae bacterium]|nr:undecaprenyl-phosphate glucose phosphotransferase [Lachnospiraceae bacterium]
MIKDNQTQFDRLQVVIDGLVIIISYWIAWMIKFISPWFSHGGEGALSFGYYMQQLLYIVPLYLVLYYGCGLFDSNRLKGRRLEIANIVKANTLGVLVIILVLYVLLKQMHISRTVLGIFFVTNCVMDTAARNLIRMIQKRMRKTGYNQKYMLLVGYSRATEEYIDRIQANPQWGYVVRGILDDHVAAGTTYRGVKVLGRIANLMVVLPESRLDEIAITLGLNEYFRLEEIVALCEKSGVHTKFIPDYYNIIPTKPYTEDLQGLPVINIRYVPLSNTFNAMIKRITDVVGSMVCIVLFSPVMLLAAIGVKCTSPGPLIYKQTRVGLHNRSFEMFKFRSMEIQKESQEKKAWTVKDDPRVTRIGRIMRKTSIDELPQLFNVLKGDMSLIGPRPERPFFVEKFREEIPRYMIKHQVRPGMTGWAQVNGYRGDTSIRKRIDCDLYYIENWTFSLDVKILFLTVFRGFVNKNAY